LASLETSEFTRARLESGCCSIFDIICELNLGAELFTSVLKSGEVAVYAVLELIRKAIGGTVQKEDAESPSLKLILSDYTIPNVYKECKGT
jgi:hypothetical protein